MARRGFDEPQHTTLTQLGGELVAFPGLFRPRFWIVRPGQLWAEKCDPMHPIDGGLKSTLPLSYIDGSLGRSLNQKGTEWQILCSFLLA